MVQFHTASTEHAINLWYASSEVGELSGSLEVVDELHHLLLGLFHPCDITDPGGGRV